MNELYEESKDLQSFALKLNDAFWIAKCESLFDGIDNINILLRCLFFASLKNALVVHENHLWSKGLIQKPDFKLSYEYKSICIKATIKLMEDDANRQIARELYNSFSYGSFQKFDLLNVFSLCSKYSDFADLITAVDTDEITEMLCDIEMQIGETFNAQSDYRIAARGLAIHFAKQNRQKFENH